MRYLKCKCGKREMWTTDGIHDCQGCEECGTTYAGHPEGHRPLQPHEWQVMYNDHTGKPYKICKRCYHTDDETYKLSQKKDPIEKVEDVDKYYKDLEKLSVIYTPPLEEEGKIDEFPTFEIPPDDELTDDGKLVNEPTLRDFPIPEDLNEAIVTLTNDANKAFAQDMTEDEFVGQLHHGFGTGLRNEWGLWTGSPLSKWFNERGIYHADDMSGIILTSFYRTVHNKEINLKQQIKEYQKFWEKTNPNVNKGIL